MNVAFIIIGAVLIALGAAAPAAIFDKISFGPLRYILMVLGLLAIIIGVFKRKSHRR
ncbi:MAG: hypothetical protein ACP5NW_00735 [Candidatus Woesearchaeota archaeon]